MSLAADLDRHPEVARLRGPLSRAAQGSAVHLVGGAVRDLLLGADHVDVDLVVVGDAVAVARRLARETGERLVVHTAFGTAVVGTVDLAGARAERYDRPGALPAVRPASLTEDLARRDFTVNAMAVSLGEADYGALVDPHGGRADLDAGLIRTLHDASFLDDPTRLVRAARYAARLGFVLDAGTAAQARAAAGTVRAVGGPRLREALLLLLAEPTAALALGVLDDLGALAPLGLVADRGALDGLDALAALAPDVDVVRARLALLVRPLPVAERRALLDWLRVRRVDARVVLAAAAATDPVGAPDEAALLLGGAASEDWLRRGRHVRPELTGDDLQREFGLAPGPELGRVLRALLDAKRAGELPDRAAEVRFARSLLP